ncbi:ParB N-terminal domain-containing protein [Planctomycetota bacterium]
METAIQYTYVTFKTDDLVPLVDSGRVTKNMQEQQQAAESGGSINQLKNLEASILTLGMTNRPVLMEVERGEYVLLNGHHRIAIAKEKGVESIECVVIPKLEDKDLAVVKVQLQESSLHLNTLDRVKLVGDIQKAGFTPKEVAELINVSESTASNDMAAYLGFEYVQKHKEHFPGLSAELLTVSHYKQIAWVTGQTAKYVRPEIVMSVVGNAVENNWGAAVFRRELNDALGITKKPKEDSQKDKPKPNDQPAAEPEDQEFDVEDLKKLLQNKVIATGAADTDTDTSADLQTVFNEFLAEHCREANEKYNRHESPLSVEVHGEDLISLHLDQAAIRNGMAAKYLAIAQALFSQITKQEDTVADNSESQPS